MCSLSACRLSSRSAQAHQGRPTLRELIRSDFFDYSDATADLKGHDARFFCLGVSSVGMTETAHHHVTYELTLRAV